MKRAMSLVVAVATAAALVLAGQASTAPPTTVSCGQTITRSITLANDLSDCGKVGLEIGAADITVNLNGHTIAGTNAKLSAGISNGDCGANGQTCKGYANVTVENGSITGFYGSGVSVTGARGNVISKLTITNIGEGDKQGDLSAGIFLMRSQNTVVTGNDVSNHVRAFQVNGIDVFAAPSTRVQANTFHDNAGEGISVFQSPGTRLIGNRLLANTGNGIHVNSSSDGTTVSGNRADANRRAGIAAGASTKLRVVNNIVTKSGDIGMLLFDLTGSLVSGNRASANWDGIGLYAGQAGVAQYGGKHGATKNRLIGNSAMQNKHAGIWVRGDGGKDVANDNALIRNLASGNGVGGGIVVERSASGNKLTGNRAFSNRGHGISAVRGTVDGGGNRAHGNRAPQCVGVACS
jgi:parallel beta-helix repeat protein